MARFLYSTVTSSSQDLPEIPEHSGLGQKAGTRNRSSSSDGVSMMALGLGGKPSVMDDIAVASTRREPNGGQLDNDVLNGEHHSDHHSDMNKLPEGGSELTVQRHDRKQRRRMRKTQSEGVASMRASLANEEPRVSLESVMEEEPKKISTLSDFPQKTKVFTFECSLY